MYPDPPNHDALLKTIADLDDAAAMRIVQTITLARERAGECTLEWSPDLGAALAREFDTPTGRDAAPQGELARQTLLLLAHDDRFREPIHHLLHAPTRRQAFALGPVSGTLLITGALFALTSHLEFSYDKVNGWTFKFKKKPTKDTLITPLIRKLVSLLTGAPPT